MFEPMAGPVKNRGTIGILPNHFLTQFQPGRADYAHNIGMSQPTYKPFRRACMGFLFLDFRSVKYKMCNCACDPSFLTFLSSKLYKIILVFHEKA